MTEPEDYMQAADLVDDAADGFARMSPAGRMDEGEARLLGYVAGGG